MKVGPVLRALQATDLFETRLVHTGQHYDDALSRVFFDDLGLPRPDVQLDVGSGSHATQTAEILRRFEPVLEAEQPHAVVVVGDVNSTIACALATAKFERREPFPWGKAPRKRPLVVHVEAGLRSFDDDMPEEINRRLTDGISDFLMVSEPSGMVNLKREGVAEDRCFLVGNVMIDSLLAVRARAADSPILDRLGLSAGGYSVLTLHRPSNVDDPELLRERLAQLEGAGVVTPLVFPVHPRTRARLEAAAVDLAPPRFLVTEPLGYVDFVRLLSGAGVVLTDSGGIQEETTVLGVPCVTLRDNTERPVTIEEGTNVLAGSTGEGVRRALLAALGKRGASRVPRLWDGRAAERIAAVLTNALRGRVTVGETPAS